MLRVMLSLVALLGGCASEPPTGAAAPQAVFRLEADASTPVAGAESAGGRKELAQAAEPPPSGEWELVYELGETEHRERYQLTFDPHGVVHAVDPLGSAIELPGSWAGAGVRFQGGFRRDFNQRNVYSRDRFELQRVSATELRGTRAIRVNFRWIPLACVATYVAPSRKGR